MGIMVLEMEIERSILLPCEFCHVPVRICRTTSGDHMVLHAPPVCATFAKPDWGPLNLFLNKANLKLDEGDA